MAFYKMVKPRRMSDQFNAIIARVDNTEEEARRDVVETPDKPQWRRKVDDRRHRLREYLHKPKYHKTLIGLVIFDLVIVFIDLVVSTLNLPCLSEQQIEAFHAQGMQSVDQPAACLLPGRPSLTAGEWFLWAMSITLLFVFVFDILTSLFAFGWRRFTQPIFAIDAVVIVASLVLEFVFQLSPSITNAQSSPAALVLLRLWKIIRAIHAVAHSIELKNQSVIREIREAKRQVADELRLACEKLHHLEIKHDYAWQKLAPEHRDVEEMERHLYQMLAKLETEVNNEGSETG